MSRRVTAAADEYLLSRGGPLSTGSDGDVFLLRGGSPKAAIGQYEEFVGRPGTFRVEPDAYSRGTWRVFLRDGGFLGWLYEKDLAGAAPGFVEDVAAEIARYSSRRTASSGWDQEPDGSWTLGGVDAIVTAAPDGDGGFRWEVAGDSGVFASGSADSIEEAKDEAESEYHDNAGRIATLHTAPGGGAHPPYNVEERGGKYVVVNDLGEVKGTHDTKEQARQQQKALYASVPGARGAAKVANPYLPSENPYAAEPPMPGAEPTPVSLPTGEPPESTRPRVRPNGAPTDGVVEEEPLPVTEAATRSTMTPIICRRCNATTRVAKVTTDLACPNCKTGEHLDLDDRTAAFDDPSAPMDLLPQGVPVQDQEADLVDPDRPVNVVVPKGSAPYTQQALSVKRERIAARIAKENPHLDYASVMAVADQTLSRYPAVTAVHKEAELVQVPAWDLNQYRGRLVKDSGSRGDLRVLKSVTRNVRGADRYVDVVYEGGYDPIQYDPETLFTVSLPGDPMFYGGGA